MSAQSSGRRHGRLRGSVEVICQALLDSGHLSVHMELGVKLSGAPTWMEATMLLLRSLDASSGRMPARDHVGEVGACA